MKKNMPLIKTASAILLILSVSACTRFENKSKAEGTLEYENAILTDEYKSGDFTRDEQRSTYKIQDLTAQQNQFGLSGKDVDIRPPAQLLAVIDGVILDSDAIETKVWFTALDENELQEQKIWDLVLQYLNTKNATMLKADHSSLIIDTGPIIRQYNFVQSNDVYEKANYELRFAKSIEGGSFSLAVDVKNYQQINSEIPVKQVLKARTKHSIEIRFINDLLRFAYLQKEKQSAENKNLNTQPLPIKLGFDDNHQTAWIIDTSFVDVWNKLPNLLQIMGFTPIKDDVSLGYFFVKFVSQDTTYWNENELNPISLEEGKYYAQLGELDNGQTSLVWLDEDKKVLSDQEVTNLYLSITKKLRSPSLAE